MPRTLTRIGLLLASLLLSLSLLAGRSPEHAPASHAETNAPAQTHAPGARLENSLARLPASFEANAGQADARVKFVSRGEGHTLMLTAEGATLALRTDGGRKEGARRVSSRRALGESARAARADAPSFRLVGMTFVGANTRAEVAGEGRLAGRVNYFVGRDASKWRANVPTFASVRYRELYGGVDLVYHGGGGDRLEYDFVVAPGADYRPIRLRFDGAERLALGAGGELLLHTKAGTIRQSAPVVYQERGGARREVAGRYELRGAREVGFRVGVYDPALPLVIDPVLVYSTHFPAGNEMAVDAAGAVYLVGTAESYTGGLPVTPGAYQTTLRGSSDAFVAKFNPSGAGLSYLTYLGGSAGQPYGTEYGSDVAVDSAGNAYVTGITYSTDFPTVNAFQPVTGGGYSDGFVAKLDPTGSSLVYSSHLGGNESDWNKSVAVDAAGAAYVFGETWSPDFPLKNALQPSKKGSSDLFLTKVAPDGKALEYSTFLGGSDDENGFLGDLAVDAAGAAYVAGTTSSLDYPVTPGAFQTTRKTPSESYLTDAFVTKVAPGGGALVYSTYLGGSMPDEVYGLAVDASGQAHVVGLTGSADFPTQGALHPAARDPYGDGFLAKLNAAGTALVYSTYLSGAPRRLCGPRTLDGNPFFCSGEPATAVATDAAGNAYVTGITISENFPVPSGDALQARLDGPMDAYLVKLNPAGQSLYSTYLGGGSSDEGSDVVAGAAGAVYLLGYTASDDFPTVNAYRENFADAPNALYGSFVAKFADAAAPAAAGRVRFDAAAYAVGEGGGSAVVGVTRTGDLSGAVEVGYSTGGDGADERSDYTTARGTLRFAPGESSKSFAVSVTNDNSVEGDEAINLTLHDLRGPAALDAPSAAVLTIADDDAHPSAANPIDSSEFFVRQHYLDFLGREPDAEGLRFWTGEIESCGADAGCREVKRINVSAAFFLSIEFQETGYLVARLYRLAFGARVTYRAFVRDARAVGEGVVVGPGDWPAKLAANRRAYAEEFVARPGFRAEFPESLTASQYVERLNAKSSGALSVSEFAALVAGLEAGTETRATALLKVADDADFRARELAPAFVLMQYLGYLRRNHDEWPDNGSGFNFWLAKLNSFGGDFQKAEMVKAFLDSAEYRRRFHEAATEAALGSPFKLKLGETAVVLPDKLRVTLADAGRDSRCPAGTQCPTAGSVSVLLQVVKPGGASARFALSIPGGVPRPYPANPPAEALGYKFRLLQLDPEPPLGTNPPPTEALLQVDKN
ncbi:MAG TPA: SBBP repeat-containing protein [Pyrinomonadaceae bacterium]|jgi:hypothetical protein